MLHPRGWVGFAVLGLLGLTVRRAHAEPTASFDVAPPQPATTATPAGSAPSPTSSAPVTAAAVGTAPARNAPPAPLPQSIDEAKAPAGQTLPARFGDAGQWVITDGFDGWFTYGTGNSSSTVDVAMYPAVHYFVAEHVSLGAELMFRYTNETSPSLHSKTTRFGGGLIFGYDVRLGERVSLWPRAFLGYSTGHVEYEYALVCTYPGYCTGGGSASDTHGVSTTLSMPLLLHPVPHFFVGGGPAVGGFFETGESAADPWFYVNLAVVLGGWF